MKYKNRIITDPGVLGGKPIIKGTRIPVELILKMLAQGTTYEEILREYPDIIRDDILAAIAYAQDTVALEEVMHLHGAHGVA